MGLMDLVKALRSPYRSLEHIAFTVKSICHCMPEFSSNWFSGLVNSRKTAPSNCRVNESNKFCSSPLSTFRNTLSRQLSVTFCIFVTTAQLDIHRQSKLSPNGCQKQTELARKSQILSLKQTGQRM